MLKKIFMIILIFVTICSCGQKKRTRSKDHLGLVRINAVMDNIVLNTLYNMNINFSEAERMLVNEEIHYSIPLNELSEIVKTDRFIQESLKNTEIQHVATLQNNNVTIRRSYQNTEKNQVYVVELYLRQSRSDKLQQVILPSIPTLNKPILSIIIDDFGGFDGPLLDAFCALDPAVTFAIIPGLPFSEIAMKKAIQAGHEIIVHMPMEPVDSNSFPGENAIYAHMTERAIYEQVRDYFIEINMAVGANQHMGSKITQNKDLLRATLKYIGDRKFFFIDSRTTSHTVAREIANELGITFASRDLFLDAPESTDAVLHERLLDLKRLKETQNRALVITHCFDRGRLQRLQLFIEEAKKMGFVIVPASEYAVLSNIQ